MKKTVLALITLIIVGICIPTVSAEILSDSKLLSESYGVGDTAGIYYINSMVIYNIEDFYGLHSIYYKPASISSTTITKLETQTDYSAPITCSVGSDVIARGNVYYNALFSGDDVVGVQCWFEFDYFDPGELTGTKIVQITETGQPNFIINGIQASRSSGNSVPNKNTPILLRSSFTGNGPCTGLYIYRIESVWYNVIDVGDEFFSVDRIVDGNVYRSIVNVTDKYQTVVENGATNLDLYVVPPYTWTVTNPYGNIFSGSYGSEAPDATAVTVYVQNSQTGALIANAHINISASVNDNLHEVVNKTIPSGIYSIELQPTGGGMPNPDYYRIEVTANGYIPQLPYLDIDLPAGVPTSITFGLDPIAGAPEDENNTFIDFFVRDMSANPITGATVNFGGYTLITNSAGYAVLEVSKNSAYTYTVSKSGYGSLTGNVVIGADPRHTINTVLAPAVTPTKPTPIPTSTSISPTPTMTAPTGEPVSNWLDWFAAHFGMILGGGVEIGKIFMWLCFSVPVGVYVGKESKAGAAGFMAGAGIVTLFFVLIGWVPIWLLVLLALIIGLLYAKVFNSSDTGGGR